MSLLHCISVAGAERSQSGSLLLPIRHVGALPPTFIWMGTPLSKSAGMMGHKNTNMTEKYIISSFADNITGSKTYLTPDKTADENKMEAVKRQMMQMLGLSEADASTIVEGIKDKLAS